MSGGKVLAAAVIFLAVLAASANAAPPGPVKPTARDKCPVCGMFVAKYPDFVAEAVYPDGSYALFDGAKDLFKYLLDRKKFDPSRAASPVSAVYVTDYYSLSLVDAKRARFVIGSDVYGPMGRELIPFADPAQAKEFLSDHKGKRILGFEEVTADVLKGLD